MRMRRPSSDRALLTLGARGADASRTMLRAAPLCLLLLALTALPASATGGARVDTTCVTSSGVRSISFSATKYPNVRRHFRAALTRGWPRTLVINRDGAEDRRDRLLRGIDTRPGLDLSLIHI